MPRSTVLHSTRDLFWGTWAEPWVRACVGANWSLARLGVKREVETRLERRAVFQGILPDTDDGY